jgi:hypothetical protein
MSSEPRPRNSIHEEIDRAAAGLEALIEQLQTGQLKLLYAKAGDTEWSDGVEQMTRYYQQLLAIFQAIQTNRARRAAARQRKLVRLKRQRGAKKAARKRTA